MHISHATLARAMTLIPLVIVLSYAYDLIYPINQKLFRAMLAATIRVFAQRHSSKAKIFGINQQ